MRCRSCDVPLVGAVRYKDGEAFQGKFVEEDFCNRCIYETEVLEYTEVKTYQFEDITENLYNLLNINDIYD